MLPKYLILLYNPVAPEDLHPKQTPVAVTAVARELAGFVWALMVDDELHQEGAA